VSVVVGLAGAFSVLALGFGLQSAVFPSPARANRVAAEASHWLQRYRYSIDLFHSDGRRLGGACLRGSYPRQRGGRLLRGSLLVLDGGLVVLETRNRRHIRFLSGHRRPDFPAFLAVASGCTFPLGNALYNAAQGKIRISMEPAFAAGQPALALEMPSVRDGHLTVYVSPRQDRPLVAIAAAEGHTTTARIYLARATLRIRLHYRQLLKKGMQRGSPRTS